MYNHKIYHKTNHEKNSTDRLNLRLSETCDAELHQTNREKNNTDWLNLRLSEICNTEFHRRPKSNKSHQEPTSSHQVNKVNKL